MWDEWYDFEHKEEFQEDSHFNFDFFSVLSKLKDYYKILEVDYDASDEAIRSNYIRLALKWHPDKQKSEEAATSRFQEINEAYQVLSDPVKRQEYDKKGMLYTYDSNISDYLNRYKSLILTCNGLGIFSTTASTKWDQNASFLLFSSIDAVYECVEIQKRHHGYMPLDEMDYGSLDLGKGDASDSCYLDPQ